MTPAKNSAAFPDLAGRHVIVTGGASGIGAAFVAAFQRQGARVTVFDVLDPQDAFPRSKQDATCDPQFIRCNVTDTDALHTAMADAVAAQGPLHCLISNAADDLRMDADTVTPAMWDAMIAINLKHYFFAAQRAAALMPAGGSIVNISSGSYMIASGGMAPYVASNAGIVGLTRALARDWGPRGIRVNAITPGWVMTVKQKALWATPDALAEFMKNQCLKQHLDPDDIAGAALFLASDLSRMMTGQVMNVDGGLAFTG